MSTSKLRQILQLLCMMGCRRTRSGSEVHCSKRKVSATRRLVDVDGRGIGELLLLSLMPSWTGSLFTKDGEGLRFWRTHASRNFASMMPEIMRRLLSRRHAHVQYVFEDYYRKECPDGYGYTQFKKYVTEYRKNHDVSYHNTYEP